MFGIKVHSSSVCLVNYSSSFFYIHADTKKKFILFYQNVISEKVSVFCEK